MSKERSGMDAVARVRRVREQDSRIGLQQAVTEARATREQLERLREQLEGLPPATLAATAAFVSLRSSMLSLGAAIADARAATETADVVADAAREHWQHEKSRLRAIELLQEARAAEAKAEADRIEARELDDLATQAWSRQAAARDGEETP
jgi:flagellar export protein FliJ